MKNADKIFLAFVVAFALFIAGTAFVQFGKVASFRMGAEKSDGSQGKARDVDLEKIRRMIGEGTLSDHEAQFYKKAPSAPGAVRVPPPAKASPSPPLKLIVPPGSHP